MQHFDCGIGDFGPDPIARQHADLELTLTCGTVGADHHNYGHVGLIYRTCPEHAARGLKRSLTSFAVTYTDPGCQKRPILSLACA